MRKDLTVKELLVMGGGLFSMHFGAGCLLYPVTWGADAGTSVYAAYLGVFLSGIFLPWLGYLALARGRGTFLELIRRAAPRFGLGFIVVLILVLGPLFMLPRITAALWAGVVQLLGWQFGSRLPELAFNVVMYVAAFAFVSSPGKVVERVGRVLVPVLLCIVPAVIVQSIATPIAPRVPPVFCENATVHGFLAAYAVGDLQCALTYGLVLVHGIENAGIEKGRVSRNLLAIGVVGLGLLGLAHFGTRAARSGSISRRRMCRWSWCCGARSAARSSSSRWRRLRSRRRSASSPPRVRCGRRSSAGARRTARSACSPARWPAPSR